MDEKSLQIEGRNNVLELLASTHDVEKIFLQKDIRDHVLASIFNAAKEKKIPVKMVEKEKLDRMSPKRTHQGVIANASATNYCSIDELLNEAKKRVETPFFIMLDQITDTHNLGAILRSCEAFGVHGVIIGKNRSAGLNDTVVKTSAGALFHLKIAKVTNLTKTIEELKEKGFWIYGADMEGEDVDMVQFDHPTLLVIGNEGFGISRLIKENCDFMVKIPMKGKIDSLNASVAASLLMYTIQKNMQKLQ